MNCITCFPFGYFSTILVTCVVTGTDNNGISKCGNLKIDQPALVGRNITFTLTPDSHDPDAILEWQSAAKAIGNSWFTRSLTQKFTQYNDNETYYMVLTDSELKDDEVHYRIHFYNKTVHCWMKAGKLELDVISVPPPDIKLEIKIDSQYPLRMYAVCTLDNLNSSCMVNFTVTNEIIGPETNSRNMSLPHGLWMIEYVVSLNVSKEDNGTDVICSAECANFKDPVLKDSKTIKLPYIMFNISGSMLNISKGERAHVKCVADSVPASNISWIEKSDKEEKIKKQCDYEQECVLDVNADVISTQNFVCAIRYLQLTDNKTLIVNIYQSRKQRHMFNIGNVTLIGIIVGICSAFVVIVAVMVFVIRNKRNNDQDQSSQGRNSLQQRNPSRQQSQNESQYANIHIYNNTRTDNEAVTRDQDNYASNYESLSDQRDADKVYSELRSTEL